MTNPTTRTSRKRASEKKGQELMQFKGMGFPHPDPGYVSGAPYGVLRTTAGFTEAVSPFAGNWHEYLGGVVQKDVNSESDVYELVNDGIAVKVFKGVAAHLQLPLDAIGAESTIRNRLKKAKKLSTEESERFVKILRVLNAATGLFGTEEKAIAWMHKASSYLEGRPPIAPIELATQDAGVRLLEEKIQRTAYGIF